MTAQEIIQIIEQHSLTVRCLPRVVLSTFSYDENILREGDTIEVWKPTLDYFKENKWRMNPETRMKEFYKRFPEGRKFIVRKRTVDKGGWWYVKETSNTDSTVCFNRKHDKFFAPTLEDAIKMFIDSIQK